MKVIFEQEGSEALTPTDIEVVQASWAEVRATSDSAATLFYSTLFELDPALRSLFPDTNLADQKRKLMATIGFAVASLTRPETLLPAVSDLGRRHVAYGVRPAHYDTVGRALRFTLERTLGDAWTPSARSAWVKTYGLLSSTMLAAAREVR